MIGYTTPRDTIDSPTNGFGARTIDQQISRRLMDQIITVAAGPSTDGYACQVIAASNDALPGPRTGVREITLTPDHRFFEHAPACEPDA